MIPQNRERGIVHHILRTMESVLMRSCSVDLELATLSEPLLPMDEPRGMDKFDWVEKILIVVSVSTVLVILFSQTNEGLSLQFAVVLTLTASAIWLDLKMIDL